MFSSGIGKLWRGGVTRPMKSHVSVIRRRFSDNNTNSTDIAHKINIIFGSQTGTAEAFANDLEFDARERGYETRLIDANEITLIDITNEGKEGTTTALLLACYGEGEPTDNAKKLYHEILRTNDQTIANKMKYSVFGLGNSVCFKDRYNVVGKRIDEKLHQLGGERIAEIGLGDASGNINENFSSWKAALLDAIAASSTSNTNTAPTITVSSSIPSTSLNVSPPPPPCANASIASNCNLDLMPDSQSGVSMRLSSRQLGMIPSGRSLMIAPVAAVNQEFTRVDEYASAVSICIDITNSKVAFNDPSTTPLCNQTHGLQAGDHVGIFAPNPSHVVNRFITTAGISDMQLEFDFSMGSSNLHAISTLHQVLTWQVYLTGLIPLASLKILHKWAVDSQSMSISVGLLQNLIANYDTVVKQKGYDITTVLNMLPQSSRYPGLPLAALVKSLPPLSPRLYSITSDPASQRTQVSLLSRLVRYHDTRLTSNRLVDGVCSTYLNECISNQHQVAYFFRESNFHLPVDPMTPIIMVAGGTGISPFLSFLKARAEHLAAYKSTSVDANSASVGPAVLYYGCRSADECLYHDILTSYLTGDHRSSLTNHPLSRMILGFSHHNDYSKRFKPTAGEVVRTGLVNIPDCLNSGNDPGLSLTKLIEQGAYVYVCGGAGKFGGAVRKAVNELVLRSNVDIDLSKATADDMPGIRYLIGNKRYFEDLAD